MKHFVVLVLIGIFSLYFGQINQIFERFGTNSKFENAWIGFSLYDMGKDTVLFSVNADKMMMPASNMKLLTTASALSLFSKQHRFKTLLQHTGKIDENGVLNGDVYIKGGGDPTFLSQYNDEDSVWQKWLGILKSKGIVKINGRIIGDESIFGRIYPEDSWNWGDIGNYYNTVGSGLSVYDNATTLFFKSEKTVGSLAKLVNVFPKNQDVTFETDVTCDYIQKDRVYIYGDQFSKKRFAKGKMPTSKNRFKVKASMYDPAFTCANAFANYLNQNGVKVENGAGKMTQKNDEKRLTMDTIFSLPLGEIIAITNKKSDNFYAEQLRWHVDNVLKTKFPYLNTYQKRMQRYWLAKRLDLSSACFVDGCGMSRLNVLSANQIISVLKAMYYNKTYRQSLSVLGVDGTLAGYGTRSSLKKNIHAKTGTLKQVKAISGYWKIGGKTYLFSMMLNHHKGSSYGTMIKIIKLLERIEAYLKKQR